MSVICVEEVFALRRRLNTHDRLQACDNKELLRIKQDLKARMKLKHYWGYDGYNVSDLPQVLREMNIRKF